MSSAEMEKMIRKYLTLKIGTYKGFVNTVCCIFKSFPDKQNEIFDYIKYGAAHRSDRECLEKISAIVGFDI